MNKQIFSTVKVLALATVLSFGLSYVYAWTAPTATPPGGNVSAPINTSSVVQPKAGTIRVDLGGSGDSFVGTGTESNFIVRHDAGTRFTKFKNTASPSSALSGFQFTDGTAANTPIVTIKNSGSIDILNGWITIKGDPAYSLSALTMGGRDITTTNDEALYLNYQDTSGNVAIGGQGETKTLTVTGDVTASDYYIGATGKWASQSTDAGTLAGTLGGSCSNSMTPTYPATSCRSWACGYNWQGTCYGPNACAAGWSVTNIGGTSWGDIYTYSCIKN